MASPPPIVGHGRQCALLEHDRESQNLAHAYLFCGKEHLGKFTIAKWFASGLLTEGRGEEEKEHAARLLRKNLHPDLLVLDQLWIDGVCTDWEIISHSSNISQETRAQHHVKTDTIGIDDVRELQRRLHETPQTGRLCCLIRSLERLQSEAANALLKILEEPPPHVLFCCTCSSPGLLPATIVSRMRTIYFSSLSPQELLPLVAHLPEEDRHLLLHSADGAPGMILRCLHDPAFFRVLQQMHIDALRFLDANSPLERLQQMLAVFQEGTGQSFFRHLLLHLQQRLRSGHAKDQEAVAHLLFSLLHSLESNTQKFLLAADTALQWPTVSSSL